MSRSISKVNKLPFYFLVLNSVLHAWLYLQNCLVFTKAPVILLQYMNGKMECTGYYWAANDIDVLFESFRVMHKCLETSEESGIVTVSLTEIEGRRVCQYCVLHYRESRDRGKYFSSVHEFKWAIHTYIVFHSTSRNSWSNIAFILSHEIVFC